MKALVREARLLVRERTAIGAMLLLALFAAAAVALGLAETARERASIARMVALQADDIRAVERFAEDAGTAAYYSFHPTWDAPSDLSFAALGGRDISPTMLRVRALALEGQIYDNEATNPELALTGRFDLAFVVIYLAPLVLFAVLHDLWSSEREAGRLAMLRAQPKAMRRIWVPRVAVRLGLVLVALLVPFVGGVVIGGADPLHAAAFAGLIASVCLFWTGIALFVASKGARSAVNAAVLAAIWFAVTLVAPAAANVAINVVVPVSDGAMLARENREDVHAGWDRPKDATMARFYALYPAYRDSSPPGVGFQWKWYFAFQHLGDQHVAELAREWREGVARREGAAELLGYLLPPLGLQRAMHALAGTSVADQLAYQDRVRSYHRRLREFYYPYLFEDRPFGHAGFAAAPRFDDAASLSK